MSGYVPSRGYTVWLNFNPQVGHEQAGKKPAIVLISAILFVGKPRSIYELILGGHYKVGISQNIKSEFISVLTRSKFDFPLQWIYLTISELKAIAEVVEPSRTIHAISEDPDDNRIIECALESCADYIISGDNHLLRLGEHKGVRILDPASFLELFEE